MSLKHLEELYLRNLLTVYWKKELNTKHDPANNKWYTKGADSTDGGLYGDISDADNVEIILHPDRAELNIENTIAVSTLLDNSHSDTSTELSKEIEYKFEESKTKTTSTQHSIKLAYEYEVSSEATIELVKAGTTHKFSFGYEFAFSETNSSTETKSQTIRHSVKKEVPAGKIYKASLRVTYQKAKIPFTALIKVNGLSNTWFEHKVGGHYHWFRDVGTIFQYINTHQLAGADSRHFSEKGISKEGVFTNSQDFQFEVIFEDITNSLEASKLDNEEIKAERVVDILEL